MITYDGIDVKLIEKISSSIDAGIVLQDTHLFTGDYPLKILPTARADATRDGNFGSCLVMLTWDSFVQHLTMVTTLFLQMMAQASN